MLRFQKCAKLRLGQPPAGLCSFHYSRALSTSASASNTVGRYNFGDSGLKPTATYNCRPSHLLLNSWSAKIGANYGAGRRSSSVVNANVRWFQTSQVSFESTATTVSDQTLFHPSRSMISKDFKDLDKQLRSDVKTMGSILGTYVHRISDNVTLFVCSCAFVCLFVFLIV